MDKNRVILKIDGRDYIVISDKPEEYINRLGELVERNIKEIRASHPTVSTTDAAVLASINIADEYTKLSDEYESMDVRISKLVSDHQQETEKVQRDETFSKPNKW